MLGVASSRPLAALERAAATVMQANAMLVAPGVSITYKMQMHPNSRCLQHGSMLFRLKASAVFLKTKITPSLKAQTRTENARLNHTVNLFIDDGFVSRAWVSVESAAD